MILGCEGMAMKKISMRYLANAMKAQMRDDHAGMGLYADGGGCRWIRS